jgi:adenosylcobinamide-GDP ribazoletransferase
MQKQWRYFLLALGFFTRFPVPNFADFQESDLNHSVKYFPLIGILIGLLATVTYYALGLIFPHVVAVLLSMAVTIFATGAFHEDGLADSADGLGGGWDREQALAIMQDSRLGTYGAVALFFILLTKFELLSAMHGDMVMLALLCAHPLSRLSAVWLMATLPYVKANANYSSKAKPLATQISHCDLWLASFFGLVPIVLLVFFIELTISNWQATLGYVCLLAGTIAAALWWWRALLKRKLNGYTGDALGAIQQLTEIMFYLATLAWLQLIAA